MLVVLEDEKVKNVDSDLNKDVKKKNVEDDEVVNDVLKKVKDYVERLEEVKNKDVLDIENGSCKGNREVYNNVLANKDVEDQKNGVQKIYMYQDISDELVKVGKKTIQKDLFSNHNY